MRGAARSPGGRSVAQPPGRIHHGYNTAPTMAKKKTVRRRKRVAPRSVGLAAPETAAVNDRQTKELAAQIESDGGVVLAS